MISTTKQTNIKLDNDDIIVKYTDFLSENNADITNYHNLELSQHTVKIFGKLIPTPRLQDAYGDDGLFYSFSGATLKSRNWTPFLLGVKKEVENLTGLEFNFVLINRYKDGKDYIGYHSDDEKELHGPIVYVTVCEDREGRDFCFKNNKSKNVTKTKLSHNSCVIFGQDINSKYKHSIPKRSKGGVRYNMTWRNIVN